MRQVLIKEVRQVLSSLLEAAEAGCQEAWMIEHGKVAEGGVVGLYPDPGRRAGDAAKFRRDPAGLHPQGGDKTRRRTPASRRGSGRFRSRKRWRRRKPSSAARRCSCRASTIDGQTVANGKPGPMTNRLREIYVEFARATAV
jgi:D-alanine transaminase